MHLSAERRRSARFRRPQRQLQPHRIRRQVSKSPVLRAPDRRPADCPLRARPVVRRHRGQSDTVPLRTITDPAWQLAIFDWPDFHTHTNALNSLHPCKARDRSIKLWRGSRLAGADRQRYFRQANVPLYCLRHQAVAKTAAVPAALDWKTGRDCPPAFRDLPT